MDEMDDKKSSGESTAVHTRTREEEPLFDHLEEEYVDDVKEEEPEIAEEQPQEGSSASNERMEQAKQVSLQYVKYFTKALLKPYDTMKHVGPEHWTQSLISIGMMLLLLPLFMTVSLLRLGASFSFNTMIFQPILFGLLGMAAAIGAIYVNVRLHRAGTQVDYKAATVQYASLLAPAIASLILATILGLLGTGILLPLFFLLTSFVILIGASNVVILSYPEAATVKFDAWYGVIIGNLVSGYFYYKLITSFVSGMLIGSLTGWMPW